MPAGALLVASGVRQGQRFRVEGEARSDPGWPAVARCLAELSRVALWLAPKLIVDLLRLLGRCTVLAERVFAAAEDWGTGEIITRFLGVLGEMTEDAFESLAHLDTSPRTKKATISDEILRKGLGEMGECPIPRELSAELVPANLPERLRGVQLLEGKGYPSPETEVMMEALNDQGVFAEVRVRQGEWGGPNGTPFVIPKNYIKASMIMDCTPGNAADPEPPPHFILVSWTALGEWLQVYGGGGDLCMTHLDLSNAFWSFLLLVGSEGMFRFRFGGNLWGTKRLPFAWKYSPVICQRLLGPLVRDPIPPDILLIHYLYDFPLVARDRARLREARVGWRHGYGKPSSSSALRALWSLRNRFIAWVSFLTWRGGPSPTRDSRWRSWSCLGCGSALRRIPSVACSLLWPRCNGLCSRVRGCDRWRRAPWLGSCGVVNTAMGYLRVWAKPWPS